MGERKRGRSIPQTIGGVLVGFDEQTWSRRPPAQERVEQVGRLATVVMPGGLTIELPEAGADAPAPPTGDPTTGPDDVIDDERSDGSERVAAG